MRRQFWAIILVFCISAVWSITGYAQKENSVEISNGLVKITLEPGKKGVEGFRVFDLKANKEVALIELCEGKKWEAVSASTEKGAGESSIILSGFDTSGTGNTPEFSKSSYIRITLKDGKLFPRVKLNLEIKSFDASAWEASWENKCPLHFLSCTVKDSKMFYHGGFLMPAPIVDPYPITYDAQMRGTWAKNWSYAPAFGAYNTPASGLWAPGNKKLVVYDFTYSRLTDRSDRDIASAYCAGIPESPSDFFCLVYPYQKGWTELRYPKSNEIVNSSFDLIWDLDMPDWGDPQAFVLNRSYYDLYDLLPAVPAMSDLSWFTAKDEGGKRSKINRTKTEASGPGLIGGPMSGIGDAWAQFWQAGARPIGQTFLAEALENAYSKNQKNTIAGIKKQLEELMTKAEKIEIDGDVCYAWKHPLEGQMSNAMGGTDATTIHHESTFHVGAAFLIIYRHEGTPEYLPFIDGVYNWCRHYYWTRNGVPDLPWAMFSRVATAAGESFLMNYHRTFKNDPARRMKAEEAIELARRAIYKNMWYFVSDPDISDDLDPTFLGQAVDSKWWIGQVTWAEAGYVLRSMIPVYCETGDPVFKYFLRGTLERWWQGYNKNEYSFEENQEMFGVMNPKGKRSLGSPDPGHATSSWRYALPVGGAIARVVVGSRSAIAFNTGTTAIDISDYYYEPETNFQFKIVGTYPGSFDIIVSAPFRDISGNKVYVNNAALAEDAYEFNKQTENEDVYVRGVKCGDVVRIGEIKNAKKIEIAKIKTREALKGVSIKAGKFEALNLYPVCNLALPMEWKGKDSWFGLIPGERFFRNIGFYIVDPNLNSGKNAVNALKGIVLPWNEKAAMIAVVCGVDKNRNADFKTPLGNITVTYADGTKEQVDITRGFDCISNNDFYPKNWRAEMFAYQPKKDSLVKEIAVKGDVILAVSVLKEKDTEITASVENMKKDWDELSKKLEAEAKYKAESEKALVKMKEICAAAVAKGFKVAIIPPAGDIVPEPNLEGDPGKIYPLGQAIIKAGEELGVQVDALKAPQFMDPEIFNPTNYPVAIYMGHEEYIRTYVNDGDGVDALLNYLRKGGFLMSMGPGGTFPFVYPLDKAGSKWKATFKFVGNGLGDKFEMFICGSGQKKGSAQGFEAPPEEKLTFKLSKTQKIFSLLPQAIGFPRDQSDLRWRPITGEGLSPEDEFIPILSLENEAGEQYGEGIALINHKCADFKGSRLLYIWGTILDTQFRDGIIREALTYAASPK